MCVGFPGGKINNFCQRKTLEHESSEKGNVGCELELGRKYFRETSIKSLKSLLQHIFTKSTFLRRFLAKSRKRTFSFQLVFGNWQHRWGRFSHILDLIATMQLHNIFAKELTNLHLYNNYD